MEPMSCKVLVLGGGPGGYVCAIRAGQLGLDTVLVAPERLGGTCLNVGCIPSKALIHVADEFERAKHFANGSALGVKVSNPSIDLSQTAAWKDKIIARLSDGVAGLLRRAKVTVIEGLGILRDGKTCLVDTASGRRVITAEHVVIAMGSEPLELPTLPFGESVISSTEALSLSEVPRDLAVVGGGYIGLELGMAYRKLGATVTVVEAADRLLPQYDAELTRPVTARATELGIAVHTKTEALGIDPAEGALSIKPSTGDRLKVAAEKILVTVGRRPRTSGSGLETLDLSMNGRAIAIDEMCRTSMRNVWAIGDVTGEPMLAHRAMAQGELVADIIAGKKRAFDKVAIPAVCFTDPEIVSVGPTPEEVRGRGQKIVTGVFPFAANGRAMTMEAETGFIRVTARAGTHEVLGIQAVGRGVSELSASFCLALEMGARLEDIAATIHAHPTQGEAFQEASMKALGHGLHG